MAKEEDRSNIVLVSIVAGLVGAGVALLLAPRSGRETRARLQSSADDMKRQAQDNFDHLRDRTRDTLHRATDVKDRVAGALKTRKDELMDQAEDDMPPRRRPSVLTNWEEEK